MCVYKCLLMCKGTRSLEVSPKGYIQMRSHLLFRNSVLITFWCMFQGVHCSISSLFKIVGLLYRRTQRRIAFTHFRTSYLTSNSNHTKTPKKHKKQRSLKCSIVKSIFFLTRGSLHGTTLCVVFYPESSGPPYPKHTWLVLLYGGH